MRRVFRRTSTGEEEVTGLLPIKKGEFFRMEPPPGEDDPLSPAEFLQLTRMVARNVKVQVTVDLNDLK